MEGGTDDNIGGLFVDTDYKEITFKHGDFEQRLFALKTSSTDYDLTGQIIWKAADILSKYIIEELGESVLKGKSVLEVGSGPGLCGLVAQHWAKEVVLSDYQDLVMDLIAINQRDCQPKNPACRLLSAKLDWMKAAEPGYCESLPVLTETGSQHCTFGDLKLEVVIGSDIVYWTSSIQPLMNVLTVSPTIFNPDTRPSSCKTTSKPSTCATSRGLSSPIPCSRKA